VICGRRAIQKVPLSPRSRRGSTLDGSLKEKFTNLEREVVLKEAWGSALPLSHQPQDSVLPRAERLDAQVHESLPSTLRYPLKSGTSRKFGQIVGGYTNRHMAQSLELFLTQLHAVSLLLLCLAVTAARCRSCSG
jgi:hypothetical protein